MAEIAPDMKLRISVELRRKIVAAAEKNGRTLNGEINVRLEASFASDPVEERLKSHDSEIERLQRRVEALELRVTNGMGFPEIEDDDK